MPFLPDINSYLFRSSQLVEAYPETTRITTKYSLPKKPKDKQSTINGNATSADAPVDPGGRRERLPPAATLTLKTFEPSSAICLKYRTDKAAEVGRLMTGLGKLAAGELIDLPATTDSAVADDKMDIDTPAEVVSSKVEPVAAVPPSSGASGNKKKKKSKK